MSDKSKSLRERMYWAMMDDGIEPDWINDVLDVMLADIRAALLSDEAARACAESVFEDPPSALLDSDYADARSGIVAALDAIGVTSTGGEH